MIKRAKRWLGIEGVKLNLVLPEVAFQEVGAVSGKIHLYSKNPQRVTKIKLAMVEKYSRGRGSERRTDEYILGEMTMKEPLDIPADEVVEIGFTLPFQTVAAPIDNFASQNVLTHTLAGAAKLFSKVKSEYRIEAEAKVAGTALNPFDRATIVVR